MHKNQLNAISELFNKYVEKQCTVFDIGSMDINGTHRPIVEKHNCKYVGVDISPGRNVDIIIKPYDWNPLEDDRCEVIISGSCLEHVEAPWLFAKEVEKKLSSGGVFICTLPVDIRIHRYPIDCYRILPDGLRYLFGNWAGLSVVECGIKVDPTSEPTTDSFIVCKKI